MTQESRTSKSLKNAQVALIFYFPLIPQHYYKYNFLST